MSEFKTEILIDKHHQTLIDDYGDSERISCISLRIQKGESHMFVKCEGNDDEDAVKGMEKLLTEAYNHLQLNKSTYS